MESISEELEFEKKVVSVNLPKPLIDSLDDTHQNRSDAISEALWGEVLDDNLYERKIEQEKQERDELMKEKQRIERELEQKRDKIRSLEDKKTEVRALAKARNAVNDNHVQNLRNTFDSWRAEWSKGDPRAPTREELVEQKAKKISEHKGVQKEKVIVVLRAELNL